MADERFSGRFLLRAGPDLHAMLHGAAAAAGLSLNEYCVRKLSSPCPVVEQESALAAVRAAARVAGKKLLGVVAFGSWARCEEVATSDVDLLVVVDRTLPVTRRLYRAWDAAPVDWDGHPVEPHFVHLPAADELAAGVWAEAALDGIVLFEHGFRVTRRLAGVRRDIAGGRIRRQVVHGQPYWVEAA